jgi:hypothetical protein
MVTDQGLQVVASWQVFPRSHCVPPQLHWLATHVNPAKAPHVWPQAPQLAASVASVTSHPSVSVELQSAKPVVHAMWQVPLAQVGVELAYVGHTVVQVPQLSLSFNELLSHPSAGCPLQSLYVSVHV